MLPLSFLRPLQRGFTADAGAATGPGRAAMRRDSVSPVMTLTRLAVDAEVLGDDLADDRLRALALLGHRDQASDLAGRRDAA